MDVRITSERLNRSFKYDWLKYLAVTLVAVFLSIVIFGWIDNPKAWEKIEIFIVCNEHNEVSSESLSKEALAYLNENVENNMVTKVNVSYVSPSDDNYRSLYSNNGGMSSTIMILPYSEMMLTATRALPMSTKEYKTDITKQLSDCLKDYTQSILSDVELYSHFFDGTNDNLFVYEYEGGIDDDKFYVDASGKLYGLRVDNLPFSPFKFYQYDGASIKYKKDDGGQLILDGDTGLPIEETEPGYLVLNAHATAYTIGRQGAKAKYYGHTESYAVAKFLLEKYYYGG